MVKTWLFEFFHAPAPEGAGAFEVTKNVPPEAVAAHFDKYWERWIKAEGYGFEGIFFSEHHFGPGYSPSPNLLIAAMAPVTKTLRLGVMGVVLPYYQPWRVVEEMGMLDHLTGGRLEVGTAAGIPPEMAQVKIGVPEASGRNAESQEILDWVLTHPGQPLNHHGEYWNFDNLTLVPGTLQQPPPRWTTVVSEESARRAGRRGTKICTGFSSVKGVKQVFAAFREDAEKAGFKVDSDWLALRRNVIVSLDAEAAREAGAKARAQSRAFFEAHGPKKSHDHGSTIDAPKKSQGGAILSDEDKIAGGPAEVAEEIIEQCRATGAGHFLAMFNANDFDMFDVFAKEVLPILKKANIELPALEVEVG